MKRLDLLGCCLLSFLWFSCNGGSLDSVDSGKDVLDHEDVGDVDGGGDKTSGTDAGADAIPDPEWKQFSILGSSLQTFEPRVKCNVSPSCQVYMTQDLSVFSELGKMSYGQVMGVLGRKDSTVIVSIPMPDRNNAVQVVILGDWVGENLTGANDRVECTKETCQVYQTSDMANLSSMDVVPLGRQMGILGMKGDVFFVSIPMPDRQNAVQAIRLSEGWIYQTNIVGYPSNGLTPEEVAGVTKVLQTYPSSFRSMSGLVGFRYDPNAANAYIGGANEIIIDPNTRRDKSIEYVGAHELAHAWSHTYGQATWLGYGRFIGPGFAESGGSYEKCFPCDAGLAVITDCYAAGYALASFNEAGILPDSWIKKMVGFDEDFAETVSTHFGFRTSTWVDDQKNPCTPTNRRQWIQTNMK